MSVAALDASLQLAKRGRYLWSEALTVGARARAGREAGGAGGHWGVEEGRARTSEVAGRMQLGGAGDERARMEAAVFGE